MLARNLFSGGRRFMNKFKELSLLISLKRKKNIEKFCQQLPPDKSQITRTKSAFKNKLK
jgi:hypothetical protein